MSYTGTSNSLFGYEGWAPWGIAKKEALDSLPLISCLNCSVVWETQFFKYNSSEKKIEIIRQDQQEAWQQDEEDMLSKPLPQSDLKLVPLTKRDYEFTGEWTAFDYFGTEYFCRLLDNKFIEDQHKHFTCMHCEQEMAFIASITEDTDPRTVISVVDFSLGEMILHFHFCSACSLIRKDMEGT